MYAIIRVEKKWFPDRRIFMEVMTKVAGQAQLKATAEETKERLESEIESDVIQYHELLRKPTLPLMVNTSDLDEEGNFIMEADGLQSLTKEEEKWMQKYQSCGIMETVRYEIQQIGKW